MSWFLALPFVFGAMAVLQAAMNRQIGAHWGLGFAVFLNASVLICASFALFIASRSSLSSLLPELFRARPEAVRFSWWYVLPGLFGFSMLLGLPWAITRLGTVRVFVSFIAAQLVASLLWDALREGQPVTWSRAVGSLLAFLGALLAVR